MNTKHISILSAVLAVVLVVSAYLLTREQFAPADDSLGLAAITPASVTALRKSDVNRTMILSRADDAWSLDGQRLEQTTLDAFLVSLANAHVEQVAKNGRATAGYGFVAGTRTLGIEYDGTTRVLDVGGRGPHTGTVYVSPEGSEEVYLLSGTTLGDFASADWTQWVMSTSTATSSDAE
jgi:hypothetical protein